jgi:hypothetical protein
MGRQGIGRFAPLWTRVDIARRAIYELRKTYQNLIDAKEGRHSTPLYYAEMQTNRTEL